MVIVAGHPIVAAEGRELYPADPARAVEQARRVPGCLDSSIAADLRDPDRITIFERRESRDDAERFRGSGPSDERSVALLGASVAQCDVADVRSLT